MRMPYMYFIQYDGLACVGQGGCCILWDHLQNGPLWVSMNPSHSIECSARKCWVSQGKVYTRKCVNATSLEPAMDASKLMEVSQGLTTWYPPLESAGSTSGPGLPEFQVNKRVSG